MAVFGCVTDADPAAVVEFDQSRALDVKKVRFNRVLEIDEFEIVAVEAALFDFLTCCVGDEAIRRLPGVRQGIFGRSAKAVVYDGCEIVRTAQQWYIEFG